MKEKTEMSSEQQKITQTIATQWPEPEQAERNKRRAEGAQAILEGLDTIEGLAAKRQDALNTASDLMDMLEGAIIATPDMSAREISRVTGLSLQTVRRARGANVGW